MLKYINILISLFASISITSVYSQELKEYESELLKNKLQYPDDWEENKIMWQHSLDTGNEYEHMKGPN